MIREHEIHSTNETKSLFQMKCPECNEFTTFTREWTATMECSAPLKCDKEGEIEIDYDNVYESDWDEADEGAESCLCDSCGGTVYLDEIEVFCETDEE